VGTLAAVAHQLTFINPFTASNREFVSVPYLLSDFDGAVYNVLTHELSSAGPVSVSTHRVRSSYAHGFGDKINAHLAQAFDEIEEEVTNKIASGYL
jgi:hypothetical protein